MPCIVGSVFGLVGLVSVCQSLEFVAEMRILAETKIENCRKMYFLWEKNWQAYFFFYENSDDGSVNANWRYKIDIRHEFQCARFLQIYLQNTSNRTDFNLDFQNFAGQTPLEISSFFFISNSRLWYVVTGWDGKLDLEFLSQCRRTWNCLSRCIPEKYFACTWAIRQPSSLWKQESHYLICYLWSCLLQTNPDSGVFVEARITSPWTPAQGRVLSRCQSPP